MKLSNDVEKGMKLRWPEWVKTIHYFLQLLNKSAQLVNREHLVLMWYLKKLVTSYIYNIVVQAL